MAFDPTIVGYRSEPHRFSYDWRTLATYALGIGAKRDELPFLYEGSDGGMAVYPSFAVIPSQAPVFEALLKTGGDLAMIVHGGQRVRVVGAIEPEGELSTTCSVDAVYDLKKFAQVILSTVTSGKGGPVYETTWSIIFRGAGGFAGPRPTSESVPSVPKEVEPTFSMTEPTTPEQALLYRISGDQNPLHADPAFAERVGFPQGPILHGLCTFGFVCRAVVRHACGGDPRKLRTLGAQFRRPVWPGDTLKTDGWDLGDGAAPVGASAPQPGVRSIALLTSVTERSEAVLSNAFAEVTG